jgi:hypothetical protein
MVLRNVGILPHHYTESQSKGPRFDSSLFDGPFVHTVPKCSGMLDSEVIQRHCFNCRQRRMRCKNDINAE